MSPLVAVAGVVVAGAGAVAAVVLGLRSQGKAPGDHLVGPEQAAEARGRRSDASDPAPALTRALARVGISKKLQWELLQAGLLVRPSEVAAVTVGLAGAGFVVGLFLRGLFVALILAAAAGVLPTVYIALRKARRKQRLVDQLADALAMMASSLRSGYSFMRAMQVVRDEMEPPIAEEFGRVLDELNVGIPQERALKHLQERCPNPDIELVVTACQIQASIGGNLAEILDTTAEMIRERVRLQGEIAALTAEGRLSAAILTALPILLALIVNHLSPGYLNPLVETRLGLMLLGGGVGAMMMGVLLIKKLLAVQV